jgi:hypothetical protein
VSGEIALREIESEGFGGPRESVVEGLSTIIEIPQG